MQHSGRGGDRAGQQPAGELARVWAEPRVVPVVGGIFREKQGIVCPWSLANCSAGAGAAGSSRLHPSRAMPPTHPSSPPAPRSLLPYLGTRCGTWRLQPPKMWAPSCCTGQPSCKPASGLPAWQHDHGARRRGSGIAARQQSGPQSNTTTFMLFILPCLVRNVTKLRPWAS